MLQSPGHATGTVSSAKPYVRVQLGASGVQSDALPVTDGAAAFDLPTWGYATATVRAVGCASTTVESCDTESTESPEFTPTEVALTVTWPTSKTVSNYPTPTVTVSDPEGGGSLRVVWVPDVATQRIAQQEVSRNGTTDLTILASIDTDSDGVGNTSQVDDGLGTLVMRRCSATMSTEPSHCRALTTTTGAEEKPVSVRIEVDHSYYAVGNVSTPNALSNVSRPTIGRNTTSLQLPITVSDPGTYQLSWQVVDWFSETQVWDQGTQTLQLTGTTTTLNLPIDPLSANRYSVVTWLTRASSAGGSFATQILRTPLGGHPQFNVDGGGPSVSQLVAATPDLFPAPDGFRDSTGFSLSGQSEPWTDVTLSIADESTGEVVRTLSAGDFLHPVVGPDAPAGGDTVALTPWDGHSVAGGLVPAGWYVATATAHDVYGNPQQVTTRVHVSAAMLTRKTWTGTVTANGSRVAAAAGRCSSLRTPASRRWAGSLLFGAGSVAKCKPRTAADRTVQATHQVRLPALPTVSYAVNPNTVAANPGHYDTLAIYANGGASTLTGKTRSTAAIRWINAANRPEGSRAMSAAMGNHAGTARLAAGAVRSDGTVRWNTYATGLSSYDVRQYTITLSYTALQ